MELILINKNLHTYFAVYITLAMSGLIAISVARELMTPIIAIGYVAMLIAGLLVIMLGLAYSGLIGNKEGICYVKDTCRPRAHEHFLETSAYKKTRMLSGKKAKEANNIKIISGLVLAAFLSAMLAIMLIAFVSQILHIPG